MQEPQPFGQALTVYIAPNHAEQDQPDQEVFGAVGVRKGRQRTAWRAAPKTGSIVLG